MTSHRWRRALCALGVSFGLNTMTLANEAVEGMSDTVVITATRTPTTTEATLTPITVLTQSDIEQQQSLSFQDLLRGQPGVQLSNNGGLGKATNVFLRGANADQVLVLVDGVRIGSSSLGTAALQYLPVDNVARVEIVRGPLSSLYGSEAVGGVIQIFTQPAANEPLSVAADASTGSHHTSAIGARLSGSQNAFSFGLSANHLSTDGYPNCTGAPYVSPSSPGGGCYVFDTTDDGYHNTSGSAWIRANVADEANVTASLLRSQGHTRYAGAYTNAEDFVEQVATLAAHWSPLQAVTLTAQLGQSSDNERDTLNGVEPPGNRFDTTRQSAALQADIALPHHQLVTMGSDVVHDELASDIAFAVSARTVTGVFAEYQMALGSEHLATSVRRDDNSQFGAHTSGSAAWGHDLTHTLKFVATYGTAFHAPSFDDLYYPNFGNPRLSAETEHSVDGGIEQRFASAQWSLHVFSTRLNNLIAYDAVQFAPENIGEARNRGVELQGATRLCAWQWEANAAWLEATNQTPNDVNLGNDLPRRARWTGHLMVARDWRAVRIALRVDSEGRRFDDLGNTEPLGGFATADLRLDWSPRPDWAFQAKLANALDRRYAYALYYPQDQRTVMLTVRYHPSAHR